MAEPVLPDAIDESFAPARSPDAYAVVLDGEAVVLDERLDRLHLLNHTATLLWQLFDGAVTLAELADRGIDPAEALAWMARTLDLAAPGERVTATGLVARFDPDRIPAEPTTFAGIRP